MSFRILAIGDVVSPDGVKHLREHLWNIRRENNVNMVICNGENAAIGNGIDPQSAENLLSAGCDVLTGGNHSFKKKEIRHYLENTDLLLRPANYPWGTPGFGYTIRNIDGFRVLVINLMGVIFMDALDCPFRTADRILEREEGNYDFSVVDIHAEATSEKIALARYLDGRVNIVFGTHTHVPTADCQILPKSTGYVTDLGMTGSQDGVLGVRADIIIEKMRSKLPIKFEPATGNIQSQAVLFTLDGNKCTEVKRLFF